MKKSLKSYEGWLSQQDLDENIREELLFIKDDQQEIYESFYEELSFGTSGLRGKMGAGTNKMNVYTVRKVTQGIANLLNKKSKEEPKVAICYDSRNNSRKFAENVVSVLAANKVKSYMFKEIMPVGALSFAIREVGCDLGIMITASHNGKEYNGYKVYDERGCQILDDISKEILRETSKLDPFKDINSTAFSLVDRYLEYIDSKVEEKYIDYAVKASIPNVGLETLDIVFTPLNGTGNLPVREVFQRCKAKNIWVVEEQELPDGNFTTCPNPNPELAEVYERGLSVCEKKCADVVIATDPDCDRVGVAIIHNGQKKNLSGNNIGVLLFDYICRHKELPENPVAMKSIVSTPMIDRIGEKYNVEVDNTLIGFKYIGDKMEQCQDRFIFGFEEGNGYLIATHTRDKDGVSAALLIAQMAAYHKERGKNLIEALDELYDEYGHYMEKVLSFTFEGSKGARQIKKIMGFFRRNMKNPFMEKNIIKAVDYLKGEKYFLEEGDKCFRVKSSKKTRLPKENIIELVFEDESKLIIRPSGTEPKIKMYISACEKTGEDAEKIIKEIENKVRGIISWVRF